MKNWIALLSIAACLLALPVGVPSSHAALIGPSPS
jgi:hypothetical protein